MLSKLKRFQFLFVFLLISISLLLFGRRSFIVYCFKFEYSCVLTRITRQRGKRNMNDDQNQRNRIINRSSNGSNSNNKQSKAHFVEPIIIFVPVFSLVFFYFVQFFSSTFYSSNSRQCER